MKKSIISLVVVVILITQSFVLLHAQETERSNHYTQVIVYFAMESLTEEYDPQEYMEKHIASMAWIKGIMERTDTTMNFHQVGFGPFSLSDDPARDSIITADGNQGKRTLAYRAWSGMDQSLKDSQNPVAQKVQSIKDQTGAEVINIVIITNNKYYVSHGESNSPIMVITNSSDKDNHLAIHNKIIFDENSTKAEGYFAQYPQGHPLYPKEYSTIFQFNPTIDIYPRKGLYKDQYGFWLQVGDDDHNVLDPDHGWKLDYLYNKGDLGTDLGFHTTPDTLTIKEKVHRRIELYPGWNDSQTGEVLYVGGDNIFNDKSTYPNELHCGYNQIRFYDEPTDLVAYAVEVNSIPDAFAMDYILVQFVESIEYPSLQAPKEIKVNDTFTVSLAGNPELMTSWEPEINISGIDYEFISSENYIYTYKALSAGQANITLHHNSLLVLEDESASINVITSVEETSAQNSKVNIFPNPNNGEFDIELSGIEYNTIDLQVIDIFGNSLYTEQIQNTVNNIHIEKLNLTPGTYYLKLNYNDKNIVKKFVVLN